MTQKRTRNNGSLIDTSARVSLFWLLLSLGSQKDSHLEFGNLNVSGMLVSSVAVLPQLWLITKTGGSVEALTSYLTFERDFPNMGFSADDKPCLRYLMFAIFLFWC